MQEIATKNMGDYLKWSNKFQSQLYDILRFHKNGLKFTRICILEIVLRIYTKLNTDMEMYRIYIRGMKISQQVRNEEKADAMIIVKWWENPRRDFQNEEQWKWTERHSRWTIWEWWGALKIRQIFWTMTWWRGQFQGN